MGDPSGDGRPEPAEAPLTREALEDALARERARSREIDHRAKNSLQLVSSLLLLVSRRAREEETRRTLRSLHQRIGAIAAVHRGFLDSERPDRFDLAAFLREQMTGLARTAPDGVALRLDLEAVEAPSASAVPLALIANELATNALAYGGPAATVTVALRKAGAGLALSVEDDGPGLPAAAAEAGFGLTMVRLLAQQLNAKLSLEDAQPGLRAVVTAA